MILVQAAPLLALLLAWAAAFTPTPLLPNMRMRAAGSRRAARKPPLQLHMEEVDLSPSGGMTLVADERQSEATTGDGFADGEDDSEGDDSSDSLSMEHVDTIAAAQQALPVDEIYPVSIQDRARHIDSLESYEEMYARSIEDPHGFWADMATQTLTWQQPFTKVQHGWWASRPGLR
ncbi:unnamed protein product [Vitrella brassicaformis CCMP3155]|uniref:Acetyl-coenzyme A synthetase N-terminal domain-containing protein n=1 Tax=Vitrella brassicaformis (strain CCMP3155) TaxID=1169540 RepID=A0A0G4H7F2_VITBC|nr:unnamed protein product [Vitrella brassicaformis CCMP3155]|eukprot:CEM39798.1 unnamed protein product [Vitrella brassicaformis CCMP3155]